MPSVRGIVWLFASLAVLGIGATVLAQISRIGADRSRAVEYLETLDRWRASDAAQPEDDGSNLSAGAAPTAEGVRADMTRQLRADAAGAQTAIRLWAIVGLAAAAASVAAGAFATRAIAVPVERLGENLARLLENDEEPAFHPAGRLREFSAIEDTLRGLRANARRRALLQKERLDLHARLSEAHRIVKDDLSAAAFVQRELFPRDTVIAQTRIRARYVPSRSISGDTYDVVERPEGGVTVFLIDVAGHGAAAGLASVAARYAVMQALSARGDAETLAALARRINDVWKRDLPYFTLLLVDFDPAVGTGSIVQAGHPAPFVIRDGTPVPLPGKGGVPIGILADADFVAQEFGLHPGDRMILLTDGVREARNTNGETMPEAFLLSSLSAAASEGGQNMIDRIIEDLAAWSGTREFDDDVTIIILEGETSHEDVGMAIEADGDIAG